MKGLLLALALTVLNAPGASAHSLKSLEDDLHDKEFYFQPLDKQAPDFALMDADGRPVSLRDLRGKVVVLHFIYTNCPDVCPLHADRIAEIQEMVNRTPPMRDAVQFLTITSDPIRDTPEVMRKYGEAHGLAPVNWTFLTSGTERPTVTRDLVQKFGHKFTEVEGGYQVHSVVTHVIDREGRWRANFHGLKFQPINLVLYINALVNDVHGAEAAKKRGLWDKLRELF
ncbi:MAG: SCO family protein [Rhodospirillales bacterium]|nr:SCO family protein [Rhodospirillales bacterium]